MSRLGIVGHRVLDTEAAAFVRASSSTLLSDALAAPGDVVAVSALAEGADSLFAEVALLMQVPLDIVQPFARYAEDFDTASSRSRYRTLAASARNETRLAFTERSTDAYKAAMQWVVENCDLLVGVWDGAPSRRRGSTAQAIRHARLIGRRVIHLDVARLAVRRRDTA